MKNEILVKRYILGLVNSLKNDEEYLTLQQEIADFIEILEKHPKLRGVLFSRFLPIAKKGQIVEEILAKKTLNRKTERFILLLVENNRFDLLADIVDSLPEAWNEKKGIYTYEVASVVPLTDSQRKEIREKLENLEKKPVVLKTRVNPELIGGLWIKRGNVVYDISIKGNLMKLKEKICERQ